MNEANMKRFPIWCWDDANESQIPLKGQEEWTNDYGTLFVFAKFRLANGKELNGYLIGIRRFYAFGLFAGEDEVIFNRNLPNFFSENTRDLCDFLGLENVKVFPVSYTSSVRGRDGQEIQGELNFVTTH